MATQTVTITVESSAFQNGQPVPVKYTGEGDNISPPLNWSNVPCGAKQLVLICDDPDAPSGTFVHWVLYNIPLSVSSLAENVAKGPNPANSKGSANGANTTGNLGYIGPMPPKGHGRHHYYFTIYALDKELDLEPGLSKDEVLTSLKGHITGQGQVMGTYERK